MQAAAHDPGDANGDEQPGHRRADDEDELEPADGAVDGAEAGGGDEGARGRGYRHDPQAELGGPAHAGHGLDPRARREDLQAGRQLRNQAGVADDESPPPVDGHEPHVVLGQHGWRGLKVIVDHVRLGDAIVGIENFCEIRNLKLSTAYLRNLGGS